MVGIVNQARTQHPYLMYDAMQAESEAWRGTLTAAREPVRDFATIVARCPRVFLVGLGTSLHAAQTGELILAKYVAGQDYRVVNTFDFNFYGPRLNSNDAVIVISQRGAKDYTALALKRAGEAGALTALICGQNADLEAAHSLARFVFNQVPPEYSHAHTYSYVGSTAVLALLAQRLGEAARNSEQLTDQFLFETMPATIQKTLALESQISLFASRFLSCRRLFVIGGGPGALVAYEIGLKIKETSYLQAEGLSTEPFIHGHFQCAEPEDGFILIAPQGAAHSRTLTIVGMAQDLGARCLVVGDMPSQVASDRAQRGSDPMDVDWLSVPPIPEPFSAVTCMVPMFMFAYHLALLRGTNPDAFRLDDPRFKRAMERVKLGTRD